MQQQMLQIDAEETRLKEAKANHAAEERDFERLERLSERLSEVDL